jgi:hypothetical protein
MFNDWNAKDRATMEIYGAAHFSYTKGTMAFAPVKQTQDIPMTVITRFHH